MAKEQDQYSGEKLETPSISGAIKRLDAIQQALSSDSSQEGVAFIQEQIARIKNGVIGASSLQEVDVPLWSETGWTIDNHAWPNIQIEDSNGVPSTLVHRRGDPDTDKFSLVGALRNELFPEGCMTEIVSETSNVRVGTYPSTIPGLSILVTQSEPHSNGLMNSLVASAKGNTSYRLVGANKIPQQRV